MSARLRAIAAANDRIVADGRYVTEDGTEVVIGDAIAAAQAATRLYGPEPVTVPERHAVSGAAKGSGASGAVGAAGASRAAGAAGAPGTSGTVTTPGTAAASGAALATSATDATDATGTAFEVTDEDSLAAARRIIDEDHRNGPGTDGGATGAGGTRGDGTPLGAAGVAVLNFASARNPGGGYVNGAKAQEEALCRASALYSCLLRAPEYYAVHRGTRDPFYTDRVIHSPGVPVFRDVRGELLNRPYTVGFLTSPAPNAGVIARRFPQRTPEVPDVLIRRAERVLEVAAAHGYRALVLGAWGCGVFRNDPAEVAAAFAGHLTGGGRFSGRFDRVVFAVLGGPAASPARDAFTRAFG
ncbi:TIGR02452 family protein [Streptantibioticus silvisoli]|uniref:TIGR02452 family protein n=1 Tax=Streptantibioticus silvisoli TaxID=2705255 RepID=A0ABT6VTN1_9ACTN|nr:TIGR02452 family protein [Streptantibioticus silvisoli]MDI5961841.1 TIGR02452 family protein [Streptantibioticus silvisoli]